MTDDVTDPVDLLANIIDQDLPRASQARARSALTTVVKRLDALLVEVAELRAKIRALGNAMGETAKAHSEELAMLAGSIATEPPPCGSVYRNETCPNERGHAGHHRARGLSWTDRDARQADPSAAASPEPTPAAAAGGAPLGPVPMVLHCPECRTRHVDAGAFASKAHHTHACQGCGFVWRPAVVATVGVRFLPGFKDEPLAAASAPQGFDPAAQEQGWMGELLDGHPGAPQGAAPAPAPAPSPSVPPGSEVFQHVDEYGDTLTVFSFPECFSFFVDPKDEDEDGLAVKVPKTQAHVLGRILAEHGADDPPEWNPLVGPAPFGDFNGPHGPLPDTRVVLDAGLSAPHEHTEPVRNRRESLQVVRTPEEQAESRRAARAELEAMAADETDPDTAAYAREHLKFADENEPPTAAADRTDPPPGYEVCTVQEHVSGPVARVMWIPRAMVKRQPMQRSEAVAACWSHRDAVLRSADAANPTADAAGSPDPETR